MKSILKDTNNSEKLLNMVSDTLILMDKDGVCVDMAVHNVDLWFMNEERLLGKNLLNLLPPVTYSEFYPEFKKVLLRRTKSVRNYIIRKSKFPQNPKRSVRFSGKGTKRSVQKRKARNTQKAETKVL